MGIDAKQQEHTSDTKQTAKTPIKAKAPKRATDATFLDWLKVYGVEAYATPSPLIEGMANVYEGSARQMFESQEKL